MCVYVVYVQGLVCSEEYFRQDLMVAPSQDLRLNKQGASVAALDDDGDETLNEAPEEQEEWKSTKQKRKEKKRAPNK